MVWSFEVVIPLGAVTETITPCLLTPDPHRFDSVCLQFNKITGAQPDAVSCLVVGTESGRILILNPAGTAIVKNIWVGITPAMIAVQVRACVTCVHVCTCACEIGRCSVQVLQALTCDSTTTLSCLCHVDPLSCMKPCQPPVSKTLPRAYSQPHSALGLRSRPFAP